MASTTGSLPGNQAPWVIITPPSPPGLSQALPIAGFCSRAEAAPGRGSCPREPFKPGSKDGNALTTKAPLLECPFVHRGPFPSPPWPLRPGPWPNLGCWLDSRVLQQRRALRAAWLAAWLAASMLTQPGLILKPLSTTKLPAFLTSFPSPPHDYHLWLRCCSAWSTGNHAPAPLQVLPAQPQALVVILQQ